MPKLPAGLLNLLAVAGAWLLLILLVFQTRPLLPIDETRYTTVAWEMWNWGSHLVPILNGSPYPDKPPLLFWLIEAGWWTFGVSETWARLVAPLFTLATVLGTQPLARALWPAQPGRALLAPWILFGCLFFAIFGTITMFDMLNALFTLGAIAGLVAVWRGHAILGWLAFGLCLGLGALTKGPVILVYTLPPALLMPWWARPFPGFFRWIVGLVMALAFGTAIGLAWAIPAGLGWAVPRGILVNDAYREAIWWGQTAGRLSESFAHARSFWWYLPLLPALLFPWLVWPRALRGLAALWRTADPGLRLCIAWALPPLVILSIISGKQPHYLIPVIPAFALAVAATLPFPEPGESRDLVVPAALVAALGVILLLLVGWIWIEPEGALAALHLPSWGRNLPFLLGITVLAAGAAVIRWRSGSAYRNVITLSGMTLTVVALIHIFAVAPVGFAYNLQTTATYVKEAVREGREIVFLNEYHGQLHFLGRLDREVFLVMTLPDAVEWGESAVRGRIVMVSEELPEEWMGREHWQMYRGRFITVWSSATLAVYRDELARTRRAAEAQGRVTAP